MPSIPLTRDLVEHRRGEIGEIMCRANKLGIIFEPPFVEDYLPYVL